MSVSHDKVNIIEFGYCPTEMFTCIVLTAYIGTIIKYTLYPCT